MNVEVEYELCLARAESYTSFLNRHSHRSICDYYYKEKFMDCKKDCELETSQRQHIWMNKCLSKDSTYEELEACVNAHLAQQSKPTICKTWCELSCYQSLKSIK